MKYISAAILFTAFFSVSAEIPDFTNLKYYRFEHNTRLNEYGPSLSDDGNNLYFYSKRENSNYTDIYYSKRSDGKWGKPVELSVFNSRFDDQSPHINNTENFMMFSSNRDGSVEFKLEKGKTGISRDIYISFYKNGAWTASWPLPKEINSSFNEENPYYKDKLLFFTRYPFRHPEHAKIFLSKDFGNKWTQALPLPEPVNDQYSSISPTLSPDGKTLFFASNRPGGYGGYDIYMSHFSSAGFEEPVNLGPKINSEKDESFFVLKETAVVFCRKNDNTGYDLYVSDFTGEDMIRELEETKKLTLRNIYFRHDSSELSQASAKVLDRLTDWLLKSGKRIRVIGHTDTTGNESYNMKLSVQRAEAVKNYFTSKGVKPDKITTEGRGDRETVSTHNDQNRRTEFMIVE